MVRRRPRRACCMWVTVIASKKIIETFSLWYTYPNWIYTQRNWNERKKKKTRTIRICFWIFFFFLNAVLFRSKLHLYFYRLFIVIYFVILLYQSCNFAFSHFYRVSEWNVTRFAICYLLLGVGWWLAGWTSARVLHHASREVVSSTAVSCDHIT